MAKRITVLHPVIHQALKDKVKNDAAEEASCTGLTMHTLDAIGNPLSEVHSLSLAGHATASELADDFWSRAQLDTSGAGDRKHFEIAFFYGDETPRRPFQFYVTSPQAFGGTGVEDGSPRGLLKLAMSTMTKTLEITFAQQNAQGDAHVRAMEHMSRALEKVTEKNEDLTDQLEAAVQVLIQQKHAQGDKTHEHRMAELEKQQKNELISHAVQFAPALARAVFKKDVFPESTADTSLLKGVLADLAKNPALIAQVLANLSGPVGASLAERAIQLKQENDQKLEAQKAALESANQVRVIPELSEGEDVPDATH